MVESKVVCLCNLAVYHKGKASAAPVFNVVSMPSYKVHPASIPKHLRIPRPPKAPTATLKPSSLNPSVAPSTSSETSAFPSMSTSDASTSDVWFSLPRFRVGLPQFRARRAAEHHPVAKLRDPISLRIYDFVVRASIPALLVYFIWWAPGGEQSDIAVVSRFYHLPVQLLPTLVSINIPTNEY